MTTADSEDEGVDIRKRQRSAAARAARMVTADRKRDLFQPGSLFVYMYACIHACMFSMHLEVGHSMTNYIHTCIKTTCIMHYIHACMYSRSI